MQVRLELKPNNFGVTGASGVRALINNSLNLSVLLRILHIEQSRAELSCGQFCFDFFFAHVEMLLLLLCWSLLVAAAEENFYVSPFV